MVANDFVGQAMMEEHLREHQKKCWEITITLHDETQHNYTDLIEKLADVVYDGTDNDAVMSGKPIKDCDHLE